MQEYSYPRKNLGLSDPNKDRGSLKRFFYLLLLIIILAVASLFVIQSIVPFVDPIEKYSLSTDFTEKDIVQIVEKMKKDEEFNFYFIALDSEKVNQATREAYMIIDHNRTSRELWQEIDLQKKRVINWAVMFRFLDVSSDSLEWMHEHPHLASIMWRFLYEEFKMTILGICYKANFDSTFQFDWPLEVVEAANKLHAIIVKINQKSP